MGMNGSGKSQFAAWELSHAPFHRMPYIIVDYKYDDLLTKIRGVEELRPTSRIPRHPGLYTVHPLPTDSEDMEQFLWRVWRKGNTGLLIDEGYMIPNEEAFPALLTQGRSLKIPMIVLTQRPSWISRFAISEANFHSVFFLNDKRDHKIVESFVPVDLRKPLPPYTSYYHDVARRLTFHLAPAPSAGTILDRFDSRMARGWFPRHNQSEDRNRRWIV